jgi:O-methyltransferase involved in polyketide biosynthesis
MSGEAPIFTARMAAVMRASHLLVDEPPPVFRDDFALALSEFTADEVVDVASGFEPAIGPPSGPRPSSVRASPTNKWKMRSEGGSISTSSSVRGWTRSRGDTRSSRRGRRSSRSITRALRRTSVSAWRHRGLDSPTTLHFVPVDFTAGTDVGAALHDAGFHSDRTTIWSWLGVMVYLTHVQIRSTLHRLADLSSPGSTLVADFLLARDLMDDSAKAADDIGPPGAAAQGEPYVSTFDAKEVAALVASSGWSPCRTWLPSEFAPWFTDRRDSMSPSTYVGLLVAQRS